jgi:hypothetical protein
VIITAPAGFVFDTGGTAPTVKIDRIGGSGQNSRNINGVASGTSIAMTSIGATQMTFTVSTASSSGVLCKLTWENLRVRPSAGTPLALGKLTKSGTAVLVGMTNGVSNLGVVREVAGGANRLVFTIQPGNAQIGSVLAPQPEVRSRDQFGNDSKAGLSGSKMVVLSLSSGTGSLLGTISMDMGTNAGNGIVTYTNVTVDAGGSKQLTATAAGLTSAVSAVFSINQATQTISFSALTNKTYGDPAFALNASASSGLPVSFSVVSGPATITDDMLTIVGAGTVVVRASQAGDVTWSAAAPVDRSLEIEKATLMIKADNKNRVYGANNPALTFSCSGFVNDEDESVLSGAAALDCAANGGSPVGGSPYLITAAQGSLGAANYDFTFASGELQVTPAATSMGLTASGSPVTMGSNVTITATLSAVAPASGLPGGTVQFKEGGVLVGSVNVLSGTAILVTSSLTEGVHTIRAEYQGDGNFLGTTNEVEVTVIAEDPTPVTLTGITAVTNGMQITLTGASNHVYHVERTLALEGIVTVWQDLGTVTTDGTGRGEFTDTNPAAEQGYYRTVKP